MGIPPSSILQKDRSNTSNEYKQRISPRFTLCISSDRDRSNDFKEHKPDKESNWQHVEFKPSA